MQQLFFVKKEMLQWREVSKPKIISGKEAIVRPFAVAKCDLEDLHCYEFGNPNENLVFLVHGWDSNAGSLSRFETELASNNYRIISFDLPAHTNTKETHTNLYICK